MQTCCDNFTPTLTPALSLRERENHTPSLAMNCVGEKLGERGAIQRGPTPFPLPAGEGQGEGERCAQAGALEFL